MGSVAGLTTVTLPGISKDPLGSLMVAASPTFTAWASTCGTLARATTVEMSTTVASGWPVLAMSPG